MRRAEAAVGVVGLVALAWWVSACVTGWETVQRVDLAEGTAVLFRCGYWSGEPVAAEFVADPYYGKGPVDDQGRPHGWWMF
jgi:hypothetical protein